MVKHQTAAAKFFRRSAGVGNEQYRYVFVHHNFANAGNTLSLKSAVAHRKGFVYHQYFRVDGNRKGKTQARLHATGIRTHGLIDIHTQLSEVDYFRLNLLDFFAR